MNVILLAAGLGSRLADRTKDMPKCMLEVNGEKIIDRMLKQLKDVSEIKNLVVVTGYKEELLKSYILDNWGKSFNIKFVHNEIYATTNNMYSLFLAKDFMLERFMILESDVVLSENIFPSLIATTENTWQTDQFKKEHDGCMLTINSAKQITKVEIIRETLEAYEANYYKSMGILVFNNQFEEFLCALKTEVDNGNTSIYYDLVIAKNINDLSINVLYNNTVRWMEIDNEDDLKKAEKLLLGKS